MKETYEEAITRVFADEGGYSNDAGDPGGPTNWGITIADARMYWKSNATASDVRGMPKSVAEDIYRKHYASPLHYDDLPSGVDYAVLDFGINSGDSRSVRFLQRILEVPMDGRMGPVTISAAQKADAKDVVTKMYDQRLAFLKSLPGWRRFGKGWGTRVREGKIAALKMVDKYPYRRGSTATQKAAGALIIAGGSVATASHWYDAKHIAIGLGVIGLTSLIGYLIWKR